MTKATTRLRQLLASGNLLMAPGASDAVTARLVAQKGFDAIYMSGAGTCAIRLGQPDTGVITLTEMAENAQNIAAASGLPLISDADDGFGGVMNVMRTVRRFEQAGVAAIHIEDQMLPKRCGHFSGKAIVPVEEMVAKIRAAMAARTDPDFMIIARTDALAVEGFEAALKRAKTYADAGADAIFVEAPTEMEQIARIPKAFSCPAIFNMASSGKTPFLHKDEIAQLGFKIAIYPIFTLLAAVKAASRTLDTLKADGSAKNLVGEIATFREFFTLLGLEEVQALEKQFGVSAERQARF
ncbi:isocitrate lyase/PEP mutase family protein [Peristeroidobacter soli]|uniref:isocitrate lyase/PEP mutase family protein n=1 Tax=Peristeroidobacter soli TaxID=2497877 RepID=UPI001C3784AF|nr:isocitrate lyase/phosphoenolpyruvate mutase family protein [Peristeroidobacter soli]